jgi:bifunctional DNA-binding transcriptional regulator/antitoxin component of YhaV-PrlF toxin-antitoxin module
MIKILIPANKGKTKTDIRGFWYSQDNHKTYYDYLRECPLSMNYRYNALNKRFYTLLEVLQKQEKQEAIFFISGKKGYVFYNRYKIEVLKKRIYKETTNLKQDIKYSLKKYNGVTVYKVDNRYYIEVFYNE